MKVVLTGGAGFIGSHLAHLWVKDRPKDELIVLDKLTYAGHRETLAPLEKEGKIQFVQGDINDGPLVEKLLEDAALLLHLAAETHVDRSIADPAPFLTTNVLGTRTLLEAARKRDVGRFYLCSTDEVFGSLPVDRPDLKFTRDSRYEPRSPYSASKAAADHLTMAYHATYGLPTVISHCGNNFGPHQHPEKLIPVAITKLLRNQKVPVYGDGLQIRDWIYVEDHARAIEMMALHGKAGETYLVGADGELTNREVVRQIAAQFGQGMECVDPVPDRLGHDRRYAIDSSYLRETLGWAPQIPFKEALSRTIAWYRANEAWWGPMLSPSNG